MSELRRVESKPRVVINHSKAEFIISHSRESVI